jgi:hypothetical protein
LLRFSATCRMATRQVLIHVNLPGRTVYAAAWRIQGSGTL